MWDEDYDTYEIQQYTPQQMKLHEQQFQHVDPNSYLSKLAKGDQATFSQIEEPALRQYNQVIGGIGSRFSGMGMGGMRSSGFQNTQTSAARDFASQLQSNRQNLQRQALMDLMGYSNTILGQRPYERGLVDQGGGSWGDMGSMLGMGAGAIAGMYMGNPYLGAQLGRAAGGYAGSYFR
jgi:hypothetical protein